MKSLFFALWPDPATRQEMVERRDLLKTQHKGTPDRWFDPACYHLSLQSLPPLPDVIPRALAAAEHVQAASFDICIDQAAGFLNRANNKMPWWLAPSTTPAAAKDLRRALRDQLKKQSLLWGNEGFSAHLTLIYDADRELATRPVPALTWPIQEFVLLQGDKDANAAFAYQVLGRWPLTGSKRDPVHSPQLDLWDNPA